MDHFTMFIPQVITKLDGDSNMSFYHSWDDELKTIAKWFANGFSIAIFERQRVRFQDDWDFEYLDIRIIFLIPSYIDDYDDNEDNDRP